MSEYLGPRERSYAILLEPDPEDGTYAATVPALPGVVTQGRTVEEAIALARDAIALHIQRLIAHGEPVPEEHERPRILTIRVAA